MESNAKQPAFSYAEVGDSMSGTKTRIDVRINGKDYTLIHQYTDEYIQRIVLYLNKKIEEVNKNGLKLSETMELVLAALNITDELFKSQKNYMTIKSELNRMMDEYEELKQNNKLLSEQIEQLLAKIDMLEKELIKKDVQLSGIKALDK